MKFDVFAAELTIVKLLISRCAKTSPSSTIPPNKKRTTKGAFHTNDVTADGKTRKPMVFAAELTIVNEQRKPEAEAVLPRLSSHLFVVTDWHTSTE